MAKDYYQILGVDRGADEAAIKKAYRKLAMECHPDRCPGDKAAEQRFKDISEAYDVLKDKEKRAAYDHFGHAAFQGGGPGFGGFGGFGGARQGADFAHSFSDVFEDLFGNFMEAGRRRPRSAARRGADVRHNLVVSLEDAWRGREAEIRVASSVVCEDCHGSGASPGSKPQVCPDCSGAGRQRLQQGFFMVERTCPRCQGAGQVISDPCGSCEGTGRVQKPRTLAVKIPPGVEDGTRIRLSGEGEAGVRGGPPGDLYIFISTRPHDIFRREGPDLHCRVPLSLTTAALGGEIEVPTIDGKRARVKIPEGTQTGRLFRLKGKGMPVLNSGRHGDMIIEARVETPVNLSRAQKELLKQFEAGARPESWSPESSKFLSRIKEFWAGLTD